MALLKTSFSPSETESTSFDVIPQGWYEARVTGSEIKTTKAGTGEYIAMKFNIDEEEYKNRLVWSNLNIKNASEMAVRIGMGDLKAICEAVGVDELEDTEDLHDIPLMIRLIIKPATSQWPEKNEVKGYKAI